MDLALREELFLNFPDLRNLDNLNDFLESLDWENGVVCEIIGGQIFMQSPPLPHRNHGTASQNMWGSFWYYLRAKGGPCRISFDKTAQLRLDLMDEETKKNVPEANKKDRLVPDMMIVCDRSIDKIEGITGAPALIAEVLSPRTAKNDEGVKKDIYEALGVGEYWIVDYAKKTVKIFVLQEGKYKLWKTPEQGEDFAPRSFPDLAINTDEIFDDLF